MYALSVEAKKDLQSYTISGTIGEESFDDENVLKGSLRVTKQSINPSSFNIGGVGIGQMSCSFMNVDIEENDWKGKEIAFSITINETETYPIGVFTVDSASKTKGIVAVQCYDNMAKFDVPVGIDVGASGTIYQFLSIACSACGVDLGMTEADVQALPNGLEPFVLNEMGDIETWRDVIFWMSVKVVGFATMNRDGELILVSYHSTVDDTLGKNVRFNTSSYGDEVISYSGLTVYITDEQKNLYYHNTPDNGYTLNIGQDPFMQTAPTQREEYIANILANIGNIKYSPCDVTIPCGVQYDLGDVLQFPNSQGGTNAKYCIMSYEWTYYGGYRIKSIPTMKSAKSKTDKNLQGLLATVGKNEFTSYELRNVHPITIGDNEEERLIHARIASNTGTKAQIHIEVNLDSLANTPSAEFEDFEDIWNAISDTATKGVVRYLINSEEVDFHPTEKWIDGKHVLHLMYILPLEANTMTTFDAYLKAIGGTIDIDIGGVWFYASGAGLVGDGKWDGTVNIEDDVADWNLIGLTGFEAADDEVEISFVSNKRITEEDDVRVTQDGDTRVYV